MTTHEHTPRPSASHLTTVCGLLLTVAPACTDDASLIDEGTQTGGDTVGDGDGDPGDGDAGDPDPGDGTDGSDEGLCGDGVVQADEECDDGNPWDDDACTNACSLAVCGDGIIETAYEECDAGADNGPGNACTSECLDNVCGDGELGPGEGCDDGNGDDDDGCTNDCALTSCGNGIVEQGEQCDDGNDVETDDCLSSCAFVVPAPELSLSPVKQFELSWGPVAGADDYQLLESADVGEPYVLIADGLGFSTSLTVPLHLRLNASYKLRVCKDGAGCTDSEPVEVSGPLVEAIGYFKASNTDASDFFGGSVALSDDGSTLAVGALSEDGGATGIGGDQADNSAAGSGAVYVFERNGQGAWSQQAYIKAFDTNAGYLFGASVALSADGNTLAVGSYAEAVYVFERDGQDAWAQQAYVKASNTGSDRFGHSVALAGDGNTLAVGATFEDSGAVGINGDQADNSASGSGAVYVFEREGQYAWTQQAYVKASNTGEGDRFGWSVALSEDGDTLAVGAFCESSGAVGIDGNQADDGVAVSGAAYVFERDGQGTWSQGAYIKASNTDAGDFFGASLALSGDGNTLAVSAQREDSGALGIDGNQVDDGVAESGAVYVFEREGQDGWAQQVYVKASNTGAGDRFGYNLALSGDGDTLAVLGWSEDSAALGIGGDEANDDALGSGAVYVFEREGQDTWSQRAYVKAPNTAAAALSGNAGERVALSGDGRTLAVGMDHEDSGAIGIGGDQSDSSADGAGAVYVY